MTPPRGSEERVGIETCMAWRLLRGAGWTTGELAFMFERAETTILSHTNGECQTHAMDGQGALPDKNVFGKDDLLTAFRLVRDMCPYDRMSPETYDEFRPDNFPSSSTIQRRFGGWPNAREAALGE